MRPVAYSYLLVNTTNKGIELLDKKYGGGHVGKSVILDRYIRLGDSKATVLLIAPTVTFSNRRASTHVHEYNNIDLTPVNPADTSSLTGHLTGRHPLAGRIYSYLT